MHARGELRPGGREQGERRRRRQGRGAARRRRRRRTADDGPRRRQGRRAAPGRARRGRAAVRAALCEMRVLALDYGSARTGVAVSDATGTLARPVGVVERAASGPGSTDRGARGRARGRAASSSGYRSRCAGSAGAGAGDGGVRRRRSGRGSTSRSRPTTSASRRRSRSRRRPRPEDALAAAHLLQGWLDAGDAMRRGLALLLVVARSASGPFAATAWVAGGDDEAPAADGDRSAAARAAADHLPGGLHGGRDGRPRRRRPRDRDAKRGVTPRLTGTATSRAARSAATAAASARTGSGLARRLSLPGAVRVLADTTAQELVADQLTAFRRRFGDGRPRATRAPRT